MAVELKTAEVVLKRIKANLFRGIEAVGGHLKITTQRILLFEPHAINLQKAPAEILPEDISTISKVNTMLIVPNGLLIRTKTGLKYKFVVWNRSELIQTIQNILPR